MRTQRDQFVGAAVSAATKIIAVKAITKVSAKALSRIGHPGLLAGDAVEIGSRIVCDTCGVEDRTAETVSQAAGAGATVLAGATIGSIGGPLGALVGGGTGFGFWLVGKLTSEVLYHVVHQATSRR